jgi:hypothetical protein
MPAGLSSFFPLPHLNWQIAHAGIGIIFNLITGRMKNGYEKIYTRLFFGMVIFISNDSKDTADGHC